MRKTIRRGLAVLLLATAGLSLTGSAAGAAEVPFCILYNDQTIICIE